MRANKDSFLDKSEAKKLSLFLLYCSYRRKKYVRFIHRKGETRDEGSNF